MNEAQVTSELSNLLARLWFWPYKAADACPKCGQPTYPQGQADILCQDAGIAIEVKMFDHEDGALWEQATFSFSELNPAQRDWLTMWQRDGELKQATQSAWLAIGTPHGKAARATKHPRLLWIVPWSYWRLGVEKPLLPHRNSLPLAPYKGQRPKAVVEQGLNAMYLLDGYNLEWHDGGWHLPWHHPLTLYCHPIYAERGERNLEQ